LILHFSLSIPAKKKIYSTELFSIIQLEKKRFGAYLKRFSEEMLKVKNLLELMAIEALINEIHNYSI
jgi:uncharacterized protein YeaO (DUF488 family)